MTNLTRIHIGSAMRHVCLKRKYVTGVIYNGGVARYHDEAGKVIVDTEFEHDDLSMTMLREVAAEVHKERPDMSLSLSDVIILPWTRGIRSLSHTVVIERTTSNYSGEEKIHQQFIQDIDDHLSMGYTLASVVSDSRRHKKAYMTMQLPVK